MKKLTILDEIPKFKAIHEVHDYLHMNGCLRCDLGFQKNINGCCVSRGSFNTSKMIIGEAPGKEEDAQGKPFTGPAGELLDHIWDAAGLSTNDWYITNVVKCRPVAEKGSGRENLTPKSTQIERCQPFLDEEIGLLKPKIIVAIGAVATATLLGIKHFKMEDYRGKLMTGILGGWRELVIPVFPMIHPAAILHARGDKEKHLKYKRYAWEDIQKLKQILIERGIK